jgi:predicted nuclease of predicted toxin-antitoxin system
MTWIKYPALSKQDLRDAKQDRKKARFLVDENIECVVLDTLRESGFNAVSTNDVGISGHPDENVLAFAKRDDRVLLTNDADFLDDRKFPYPHNPGVVVLPSAQGKIKALLGALSDVMNIVGVSRDLWRESKIAVTEKGVWTVSTFERKEGRVVKNRYRLSANGMEYWDEES